MTKLQEMLEQIQKKHIYIQTHNSPDPDAISTAFGVKKILEHYGIVSTICYQGKIDRYNTRKLIQSLGIELEELKEEESLEGETVILVDAQRGNTNITDSNATQMICMDHHPLNPDYARVGYHFSDIRPEYGACATIIAEYFYENGIAMDRETATALSYGIRCDTDRLSRGTSKADIEMLYRMYDRADYELIRMLENRELCLEDLFAYTQAIENIQLVDKVSFANAGRNCPEALVASIADFMLALVEVEFSVVYSILDSGIKLSVRSEGKIDAGIVISKSLEGIGGGGGHSAMAGGFVPCKDIDMTVEEMTKLIQEKILKEIKLFQ